MNTNINQLLDQINDNLKHLGMGYQFDGYHGWFTANKSNPFKNFLFFTDDKTGKITIKKRSNASIDHVSETLPTDPITIDIDMLEWNFNDYIDEMERIKKYVDTHRVLMKQLQQYRETNWSELHE